MGKYKTLGIDLDRTYRNDLNQNFEDIDADIKSVSSRVENVIVGSTEELEVIDSRHNSETGVTYTTLKDRLDSEHLEVDERVTTIEDKFANSSKQTASLIHGLNVLNTSQATNFDPVVKGRTLANLWLNAATEDLKYYIATFANRNVGLNLGGAYTYANTKFQGVKTVAPVLMADFVGKVSASTVENPHIAKSIGRTALVVPSDGGWTEFVQANVDKVRTQDGVTNVSSYNSSGGIVQHLFSFNLIRHIEDTYGTIPRTTTADKVQWIKDNVAKIQANWHGFGSSPTGNKANLRVWDKGTSWVGTWSHTSASPSVLLAGQSAPSVIADRIDANGFIHYLAYAEPSDGVTASTINTDYINLEVELKPYTPTSTHNDNFVGKVSGSVVENPHTAKRNSSNVLINPSGSWVELDNDGGSRPYSVISTLNGGSSVQLTTTNGAISQQLFSFDLIKLLERKGVTVVGADVTAKVAWLKANITQIVANWHGFGSSVGGNKATFTLWRVLTSAYHTGSIYTGSTVGKATLSNPQAASEYIDSNGMIHFLAYAEPSDGVTASTINTDFIDIDVTVKNSFRNTIRPTKQGVGLYEVDSTTYNLVNVDANYTGQKLIDKFPTVDGVKHIQNPAITVQGKNLLPPFTEWTLHANATVKSPYELELNATGAFQTNVVSVNALPSTQYIFSMPVSSGQYVKLESLDKDGNKTTINDGTYLGNRAFTTLSSTAKVNVTVYNSVTGIINFTNPQLELGTTATAFEPKNEDVLYASAKLAGTTVKDELYKRDGQWWKLKRWETDVKLDGALGWNFNTDYTGFKSVHVFSASVAGLNKNNHFIVKYNGSQIKSSIALNGTTSQSDSSYIDGTPALILSLSDVDTGFTEAMTPTANMIKGYFNGWRYTGDGTTHSWVNIIDGTVAPTQTEAYVSANLATGYTPYSLSYQLATAKEEAVNVEGAISLHEGMNQVEVTSGVVVRERVTPVLDSGVYKINRITQPSSHLKNRSNKILKVFKNGVEDKKWIVGSDSSSYNGGGYAYTPPADYDTTATYEVSYIVLDKHLFTTNANDVSGSYNTNLKTNVDGLTERVGDLTGQVSINTQQIIDILVRLKAGGL